MGWGEDWLGTRDGITLGFVTPAIRLSERWWRPARRPIRHSKYIPRMKGNRHVTTKQRKGGVR